MDTSNIIDLAQWKSSRHKDNTKNTRSDHYYTVLSFHELVNESREMARELQTGPLHPKRILKAQALLNEFDNRLQENHFGHAYGSPIKYS